MRSHHTAHHKGEFTIKALGHGRFRFYRDGTPMPDHVDPSALFDTDTPVEDEHDNVAADAAGNRWDGYRMNLSYATSCLAVPRYRPATPAARNKPAESS